MFEKTSEDEGDKRVTVDLKDENTYIFGLRNIYKFLEVQ